MFHTGDQQTGNNQGSIASNRLNEGSVTPYRSGQPTRPLPTGDITFLITDIEGSTRLWERCPGAMRQALARHDELFRKVIEQHDGYVFKTVGDAFCTAFPSALEALNASLEAH
jgi:class 3 adenylate cyclase